jgi:hypothetical protein
MAHNHDHEHCGDEHDHAHDHDHDQPGGPQDNLYAHIDREHVVALNSVSEGSSIIKPWNERADEQMVCKTSA